MGAWDGIYCWDSGSGWKGFASCAVGIFDISLFGGGRVPVKKATDDRDSDLKLGWACMHIYILTPKNWGRDGFRWVPRRNGMANRASNTERHDAETVVPFVTGHEGQM